MMMIVSMMMMIMTMHHAVGLMYRTLASRGSDKAGVRKLGHGQSTDKARLLSKSRTCKVRTYLGLYAIGHKYSFQVNQNGARVY